jgi:hypothetical protein
MGLFDHLYQFDWTAKYSLQYYYQDGRHVVFDKYEIDMFGNVYNKQTEDRLSCRKSKDYDIYSVCDNTKKQRNIRKTRAVVSSFMGKPPTRRHSADHIDCTNKNNDIVSELTWMDPLGQKNNQIRPKEYMSAQLVVRDGIEMTRIEWVRHLRGEKNSYDREYTESMIKYYAQNKKYGFSYKVYEDLPNEAWYKVSNSENKMGHWEISNQNRIAYVTSHARNVMDITRFGFTGKYPKIQINGKQRGLHQIAFETFYPDAYAAMKSGEMILHKFDDKLDFRPHVLHIGDASTNGKDSHDNGCHDGTKTARKPCCSYVNGVFEKLHESQDAAVKYLRANGCPNADRSAIRKALKSNKVLILHDRTWTRA